MDKKLITLTIAIPTTDDPVISSYGVDKTTAPILIRVLQKIQQQLIDIALLPELNPGEQNPNESEQNTTRNP
jgi:hypothetical protein